MNNTLKGLEQLERTFAVRTHMECEIEKYFKLAPDDSAGSFQGQMFNFYFQGVHFIDDDKMFEDFAKCLSFVVWAFRYQNNGAINENFYEPALADAIEMILTYGTQF